MFRFTKPSESDVIAYLMSQRDQPFSYQDVGATRGDPPSGYDVDRHRVLLGYGEAVFQWAKRSLRAWRMFPIDMAELYWPDRPLETGTIVGVLFRAGPCWSLNPARIVYTLAEEDGSSACCSSLAVERFGFAYGTLPDHLERGEERFLVQWNHADDSVWYELLAFSQPRHPLARLGYPLVRYEQRRFRQLSGRAMQRLSCEGPQSA